MKKLIFFCFLSILLTFSALAKTLDQKKSELKKIFEAGGISKVEYEEAIESLENSEKKLTKKSLSLVKEKKKKKNKIKLKKDEDLEKITLEKIEKLGEPTKFEDSYFTEGMIKKFIGCNNSFNCKGQKAGQFLGQVFNRSKEYQQKNPGKMIKAMAMFEVFYSSKLWSARKALERYKKNDYKKGLLNKRKADEKEIRSLFGVNKGRIAMRDALGMNEQTPTKEAIQKFWLLGEFLDLGTGVTNKKLDKDLKKRQILLEDYKIQIANLKKELQDQNKDNENEESIE